MGIIIRMPINLSSIRCRLYPTVEQEGRLLDTLDICRKGYNHFIFESRLVHREGYIVKFDELQRIIPVLTNMKLSSGYVSKYNIIFVEDLRIENMIRNNILSKSIADSSWSTSSTCWNTKLRTLVIYPIK